MRGFALFKVVIVVEAVIVMALVGIAVVLILGNSGHNQAGVSVFATPNTRQAP